MAEIQKQHPLVQKPIFIFQLPPELLNTLTLKGDLHTPVDDTLETNETENPATGAGCATCNITNFTSLSQQREHVRSDFHRFNLKRKLAGQKVVGADEFDRMLDGTFTHYYDTKNRFE